MESGYSKRVRSASLPSRLEDCPQPRVGGTGSGRGDSSPARSDPQGGTRGPRKRQESRGLLGIRGSREESRGARSGRDLTPGSDLARGASGSLPGESAQTQETQEARSRFGSGALSSQLGTTAPPEREPLEADRPPGEASGRSWELPGRCSGLEEPLEPASGSSGKAGDPGPRFLPGRGDPEFRGASLEASSRGGGPLEPPPGSDTLERERPRTGTLEGEPIEADGPPGEAFERPGGLPERCSGLGEPLEPASGSPERAEDPGFRFPPGRWTLRCSWTSKGRKRWELRPLRPEEEPGPEDLEGREIETTGMSRLLRVMDFSLREGVWSRVDREKSVELWGEVLARLNRLKGPDGLWSFRTEPSPPEPRPGSHRISLVAATGVPYLERQGDRSVRASGQVSGRASDSLTLEGESKAPGAEKTASEPERLRNAETDDLEGSQGRPTRPKHGC